MVQPPKPSEATRKDGHLPHTGKQGAVYAGLVTFGTAAQKKTRDPRGGLQVQKIPWVSRKHRVESWQPLHAKVKRPSCVLPSPRGHSWVPMSVVSFLQTLALI